MHLPSQLCRSANFNGRHLKKLLQMQFRLFCLEPERHSGSNLLCLDLRKNSNGGSKSKWVIRAANSNLFMDDSS